MRGSTDIIGIVARKVIKYNPTRARAFARAPAPPTEGGDVPKTSEVDLEATRARAVVASAVGHGRSMVRLDIGRGKAYGHGHDRVLYPLTPKDAALLGAALIRHAEEIGGFEGEREVGSYSPPPWALGE